MRSSLVFVLAVLLLAWPSHQGSSDRNQHVTTVLSSKWTSTPFSLEMAEFLGSIDGGFFWSFAEYLAEDEIIDRRMTDKEYYDKLVDFSSRFLPASQLNLLRFSLSLREYSPKVEMHRQMANDRGVLDLECEAVVEFRGRLSCEAPDRDSPSAKENESRTQTFTVDHHHPHRDPEAEPAVLYAEMGTRSFQKMHTKMKRLAGEGKIDYVLRHYVKRPSMSKIRLSGYGVELQIKSSEYKAQDDRELNAEVDGDGEEAAAVADSERAAEKDVKGFLFGRLAERYPEDGDKLAEFRQYLVDQSYDLAPMKAWEYQDLSLQAAQHIMSQNGAEDQLRMLEDLSQNFPSHARALSRISIPKELRKEVSKNSGYFMNNFGLRPEDTTLFINGLSFDMDYTDVFAIFDAIKSEGITINLLDKVGLDEKTIKEVLLIDPSSDNGRVADQFGVDIRNTDAITWINDIEKDKAYAGWSRSFGELLRPSLPGMLQRIRKNMFHLLGICDPARRESRPLLKTMIAFYSHRAPTRLGLMFVLDQAKDEELDASVAIHNAFNHLLKTEDGHTAIQFLSEVLKQTEENEDIDVQTVLKIFTSDYGGSETLVQEGSLELNLLRDQTRDFLDKTGLSHQMKQQDNPVPMILMNGVPISSENMISVDELEDELMMTILRLTNSFSQDVARGLLDDNVLDVLDYIMEKENILPSLNDRVLGAKTVVGLVGDQLPSLKPESFAVMDRPSMASTLANHLQYISNKNPQEGKFEVLTLWLVVDVESLQGREMIRNALEHINSSPYMRIGIINSSEKPGIISQIVQVVLDSQNNSAMKHLIKKLMKPETVKALGTGKKSVFDYDVPDGDMEKLRARFKELEMDSGVFEVFGTFAASLPGFKRGSNGMLLNGLVVGPLDEGERFTTDDFNLLEKLSMKKYGQMLIQAIYRIFGLKAPGRGISDKAMKISSVIMGQSEKMVKNGDKKRKRVVVRVPYDQYSAVQLEPMFPDRPAFDIKVIVDPTSRGAQKISSLLRILRDVVNAKITIVLHCVDKHSAMPQSSYFRMVLEPELTFGEDGRQLAGPQARFSGLPQQPIFTMHHHIPENWLIDPVKSVYDLDNIKLENIEGNVYSEFELEYLLLEGHCFETGSGNPPRGLQLTIGTEKGSIVGDTIVMANLGYLQLKSNPGRWFVGLREGRTSELYDVVSHDSPESSGKTGMTNNIQVLIHSFRSSSIKINVAKKPGKQKEQLLEDTEDSSGKDAGGSGFWDSITSTFAGGAGQPQDEDSEEKSKPEDVLNVFCLASGHLYERLLKIMMLSVMRTTDPKTRVKFWVLKNFLSPSLKEFLPDYSKEYGFEFEYVQYKWPRWLNQQKEKQRIIWGYKILFLDVMFPLDVKKIIFVDTDQIVRSDLRELRDLDLEGAPYGYTPFCDSNKEMDGFRFWKSGYWSSHLGHRKYHISALYVVDLAKFRRIAAGDRLRGQYQMLSQDPNSLANLDQDLPNFMIHQVAIKSLPQEWLWCETWCDQASKAKAKSIDLCNNPLTKEPKLDAAKRIVAEWTDYDNEINTFASRSQSAALETMIGEEGKDSPRSDKDVVPDGSDRNDEKKHTEL